MADFYRLSPQAGAGARKCACRRAARIVRVIRIAPPMHASSHRASSRRASIVIGLHRTASIGSLPHAAAFRCSRIH
ncbi:hypothetical protein WS50_24345 [Burkholderia territorii]|nr:hypothetical protein WS47_08455 [Burkholderia territorii]KUZ08773.1 hypothetical protein WS50_24345 [Burkholderia territorii]